jgi:hypothetical protein
MSGLLAWNQIDRSELAALIDFDIEFEPVALVQATQARTLDCRNMNKCIGLAVIALDETKAFHGVEELDCASRLFTRQLALRPTATAATIATKAAAPFGTRFARAIFDGHRLAIDLELGRRNLAAAINESETQRLSFGQPRQACLLDR